MGSPLQRCKIESKRLPTRLVREGHVSGWDDPRMPTLRGRGGGALRDFVSRLSVNRSEGWVEAALLDHCVREHLNATAPRRAAVLRPLKVVAENYPEGGEEWVEAANLPGVPEAGSRKLPFGRELWIEREDFMEDPSGRFHRLAAAREVRLRYAYFLTCREVVRDAEDGVRELRCEYDPVTRGGRSPDGRKVKATIHWLSADHGVRRPVRLYEALFSCPEPAGIEDLDPDSLEVLEDARVEPGLSDVPPGSVFQFERLGYFAADPEGGFNRTVGLRDEWARINVHC